MKDMLYCPDRLALRLGAKPAHQLNREELSRPSIVVRVSTGALIWPIDPVLLREIKAR